MSLLRRLVGVSALLLIAATWRLWMPQRVYPQVPLVGWAGASPDWLEWGCGLAMVLSLVVTVGLSDTGQRARVAAFVSAAALAGLMLIDQHRIQPWAYEFLVVALILGCASLRLALPLVRLLVISIYVHSGLSKLDATFLDSHGQELVFGLLEHVGIDPVFWSPTSRRLAAAVLPLGELLVAAGLCWGRTRLVALIVSVVMHLGLLLVLGPWGLNHEPGVLLWNVYFIAQNVLVFRGMGTSETVEATKLKLRLGWGDRGAVAITGVAVMLPVLEPVGWFDHWPAWAVYASRPERVSVLIDATAVEYLPPSLQPFLEPPRIAEPTRRLRVDRWSLETLHVPVYPQDRFHIGVALAVAGHDGMEDAIHVVIESAADRWSGERSMQSLHGAREIAEYAERFRLNVSPRGRVAF